MTPLEKINQRRRQLHVHSILYYHMDEQLVTDAIFDKWAVELVELHKQYPKLVMKGYLPKFFVDWTGDTGMHLPITDSMIGMAEWLLSYRDKKLDGSSYLVLN